MHALDALEGRYIRTQLGRFTTLDLMFFFCVFNFYLIIMKEQKTNNFWVRYRGKACGSLPSFMAATAILCNFARSRFKYSTPHTPKTSHHDFVNWLGLRNDGKMQRGCNMLTLHCVVTCKYFRVKLYKAYLYI